MVPGHTDELKSMPTKGGGVRSDAPVVPQEARYGLLSCVVGYDWDLSSFAGSNAFLTGKKLGR